MSAATSEELNREKRLQRQDPSFLTFGSLKSKPVFVAQNGIELNASCLCQTCHKKGFRRTLSLVQLFRHRFAQSCPAEIFRRQLGNLL
jgi:hypothetical protein